MKKMMIVDDSRFIFQEMKQMLEGSNFEIVKYCVTGEEVVDAYEACRPDIVTMDIILPGMDGLQTTRELLKKYPDAKVVMVSSLAYEDTMDEAKEIGAVDFIFKPFEKSQMVNILNRVAEDCDVK